jgi:hypothetical protein
MRSTIVIGMYLVFSVAVAAYEALAYYNGREVGHSFYLVWALVSNLLLLLWLNLDSKGRAEIYRPYEFSFLVLLVWFPYLPYYLIRTRRLQGALLFVGLLALPYLGYALQWVIYVVR